MSTLVTMGCSFSQGDGCYDFSLGDAENDFINFREDNMDNFLHKCIGSNIQERFGYEKFINYAYAGSSNESQFLLFFNQLPQDENVTIIWQQTFYHRYFQLANRRTMDAGLHYEWVVRAMQEKMEKLNLTDWDVEQDTRFHTLLRIQSLYEYCKIRNWKLLIWTWMGNEYEHLIKLFPKLKSIIIPYSNPFDREMGELPNEWISKIPNDPHPNEIGYKIISDGLCDSIVKNNLDCPIPNEKPINKIKINPIFITT